MDSRPFFVGGEAVSRGATIDVIQKHGGGVWARVARGDGSGVEAAIATAAGASDAARQTAGCEREQIRRAIADGIAARRNEFVEALIAEGGKPRKFAEIEVGRAIDTIRESAARSMDLGGHYQALDQAPRGRGYR